MLQQVGVLPTLVYFYLRGCLASNFAFFAVLGTVWEPNSTFYSSLGAVWVEKSSFMTP